MFVVDVASLVLLYVNGIVVTSNMVSGLVDQSKRLHNSPAKKRNDEYTKLILDLRQDRNLGARRIQTELIRLHNCQLSLATIHKVLTTE